jgi:pimeloyl-ACP methyl ester carboxylesterase
MRQFTILILVFISCFTTYGQVKVSPNGKFFNYNDIKIYYEDTGNGEPLLLLHGFFGTADRWKPYVEAYAKQFRVIAVDMMGHGRSDIYKKDDINFWHADYAKIILALLDSLKLNKVSAIGSSSGGTTLLHLNTLQPERFKSVITIGPQTYWSNYDREAIAKIGQDSALRELGFLCCFNVKFVERATEEHGAEKAKLLTRQFWHFQKQYGDPAFTPDILSTIKAKWLVIQGDNDEFVPLQQALEMHQYIPKSRLWIVPNGGHLPHQNADFQSEFLKVSLEFLNGKWNKKD